MGSREQRFYQKVRSAPIAMAVIEHNAVRGGNKYPRSLYFAHKTQLQSRYICLTAAIEVMLKRSKRATILLSCPALHALWQGFFLPCVDAYRPRDQGSPDDSPTLVTEA